MSFDPPHRTVNEIRVGVLSDTHGFVDPAVESIFAGVDHIIHAGDIGLSWAIAELEKLAPVTAVTGNMDAESIYPLTASVELAGCRILVRHQVEVRNPAEDLRRRIAAENPRVVVFGHTHRQFCETIDSRLWLNPGYAGRPRYNVARTVALLRIGPGGARADFLPLDSGH